MLMLVSPWWSSQTHLPEWKLSSGLQPSLLTVLEILAKNDRGELYYMRSAQICQTLTMTFLVDVLFFFFFLPGPQVCGCASESSFFLDVTGLVYKASDSFQWF